MHTRHWRHRAACAFDDACQLLSACGFGSAEYTDNYHMMARFHHQRTPLLVVVCGVPCTGKSTLAAKLAQTLNFQNVLQLDALADASSGDSGSAWGRLTSFNENISGASSSATRAAFGELKKAVTEGKSVIVDGAHAHPRLIAEAVRSACGAPKQAAAGAAGRVGEAPDRARAEDGVDCTPGEAAAPRLSACDDDGQVLIVNIAVQMDRQAHASLLREWISRRQGCLAEGEFCSLLQSLQGVQEAMCDYVERSGGIVVNMTPTTHGLQMCTATVQAHVLGLIRASLKPASSCAEPHLA